TFNIPCSRTVNGPIFALEVMTYPMKILHHRHTWLILAFLAGILSISSCRKKEKPKTCTMEFRIITIDVRDSTGKMVIPESYDAIILSSGEDITYRGQGDTASV